jgi:hypothetical protein
MATRMALRLLVGAGTVAASTLSPPLLDTITFAQPDARHKLQSTNASIELHPHATPDCQSALALNRTAGGRVLFDMQVSPTEQTHLSVKYWGSIAMVNGTAFVEQANTWLLDPTTEPKWGQHGWAHSWPCELDQADPGRGNAIDGPFPDRWQYATYPLPKSWTENKTTLTIGLGTGLFQWYGAPGFMPSRALFKAYTHVEPFLEIPAEEQQGVAPPDAPPKPVDPNASAELATSVGAAVQHLFDVQVWNWTLVELGQMPACLFGAVSQNGFGCPMLKEPDCVFNPHTHQWPAVCKANVSSCKQHYQSSDDRGNLPWTTSMSKHTIKQSAAAPRDFRVYLTDYLWV